MFLRLFSVITAMILISGCGPSRDMIITAVSGVVLLDGSPLQDGEIHFFEASTRRGGMSILDENGCFTIDPIPGGDYQITILPPGLPHPGDPVPVRSSSKGPLRKIPERYRSPQEAGLKIKLDAKKRDDVVFELKSR